MNTIIEILESPSFEDQIVTRFESSSDGDSTEKFHISVQRIDKNKSDSNVEIYRKKISTSVANNLIIKISSLTLTACPEFVLGLDGTTTELRITRGFNECRLSWWGSIPIQWNEVSELIFELRQAAYPEKHD